MTPREHPPDAAPKRDDAAWRAFTAAWKREVGAQVATPPWAAADRVLARLAGPRRAPLQGRPALRLAAGLAAALLLVALPLWLRFAPPAAAPERAGEVLAAATPGEDELLLWLDDATPLYLTLEPAAAAAGR